jgi:hypothetical protein
MEYSTELTHLTHGQLRAIASHLRLRRRGENRRAQWLDAIAHAWGADEYPAAVVANLSEPARQALRRLCGAGSLPAALFFETYGPVRTRLSSQPHTPSEALLLCGLLVPHEDVSLARCRRVAVPASLRERLLAALPPRHLASAARPLAPADAEPPPLLHDLYQLLIYLQQQPPDASLLHGRWLAPRQLRELLPRLYGMEAPPRRTRISHKGLPWLRFLMFLSRACDWQRAGQLTPLAWSWLAQPPAEQMRAVWRGWLRADPALRTAYAQPAAGVIPPWQDLLCRHLIRQDTIFDAWRVSESLLGAENALDVYLTQQFPTITAVDRLIAATLSGPLQWLGVVTACGAADHHAITDDPAARAAPAEDLEAWTAAPEPEIGYSLTPLGRWLLDLPTSTPPQWAPAAPHGQLHVADPPDAPWRLHVTGRCQPAVQARLAPYVARVEIPPPLELLQPTCAESAREYALVLTADSVAAAAARAHGVAPLLCALEAMGALLTPPQVQQLYDWHARGRWLTLEWLPLLRTRTAAQMARVQQTPALRTALGEVLSPTAAVVQADVDEVMNTLVGAGFHANRIPAPPGASASCTADETAQPAAETLLPDQAGVLWLACCVYQLLGQQLSLPLPLPTMISERLRQQLDPAEESACNAALAQIRSALESALDGYAPMPPPQPADPEPWRALIQEALDAQQHLEMVYFSAGRNVTTRRIVTPYWIETHRNTPYLCAYCHSAERVLTFRLDRIQSLSLLDGSGASGEEDAAPDA